MKRDDTSARKLQNEVNYTEVVQSEEFQLLLNKKKKFIVPMSIFFLSFFYCFTYFNIVFKGTQYTGIW